LLSIELVRSIAIGPGDLHTDDTMPINEQWTTYGLKSACGDDL
jgi:hypothetical protein